MKAIYQKPTTEILSIDSQVILSASLGGGENPNSIDLGGAGSTDDLPDGFTPGARGYDDWD